MSKLKISPDLSLPTDAVTSTLVVYGGKGMGKTNLASVLVEEFAAAHLRFAVIDPMGVWWGLRHGDDGKGDGIKALILGGIHGDMPIEPASGALVADLVADEDDSVVIDISRRADGSMWAIAERVRFVTDYAKRLYQRQGEKRRPIMQVIDEAARFAPQVVRAGDLDVAKCMGAVAVLVEEGRNVGIGVTLVTQRSARLNKDVAELADCMIAFRIVGPNSMRAVLDWLGEHVDKARLKDIGEKLRSLPRGSALVISPGWLEFEGIVAMRKRETFDSSQTPKPGKQLQASGPGAKIDLDKYRARMTEVIERANQNDPKALKARIAELEKQVAAKPTAKPEVKTIEKLAIKESQLLRIGVLIEQGDVVIKRWDDASANAHEALDAVQKRAGEWFGKLAAELGHVRGAVASTKQPAASSPAAAHGGRVYPSKHAAVRSPVQATATRAEGVSGPQQRILDALAMLEHIGVRQADKTQLALFAGASPTSSSYSNNLSGLRTSGLIDYPTAGTCALTATGRAGASAASAPSTTEDLHAFVRSLVKEAKWKLLAPLIEGYPDAIDKSELADAAGASATSSSFSNNLSSLRTLGLIDYPQPGSVRAQPVLFLEGGR